MCPEWTRDRVAVLAVCTKKLSADFPEEQAK
jgi:hypothetical protein